jgi:gluconate 5-dehydrogenase
MPSFSELSDLRQQVAIVTGGAGRLGSQMSDALAEAGAHVVVAARNLDRCLEKANHLSRQHQEALAIQLDVTSPDSVRRMVQSVQERFGRIDILVNAAYSGTHKPFEEMCLEDFESALRGALSSTFLCSQAVSTVMKPARNGAIINIASTYGIVSPDQRIYGTVGNNSPCNYGPAKAGVIQFTRWLATYLAPHGIRVNCLTPGGFYNASMTTHPGYEDVFVRNYADRTPLGRMGGKSDLKGAIVFLASRASEYVVGQNVVVDGGWTAW